MNKLITTGLVVMLFISLVLTIRTCKLQKELDKAVEDKEFLLDHPITETETIWREVIKPKQLPNEVKPKTKIYSNDNITHSTEMNKDTDSIVGVDLNKSKLTFTFQNQDGLHQSIFQIKPNEYHYVWVDGVLTAKRLSVFQRIEFKPYTSLSYRPFHNLLDLDLGISLKHGNVTYSIGGNLFYYPKYKSSPGIDAVVKISYQF